MYLRNLCEKLRSNAIEICPIDHSSECIFKLSLHSSKGKHTFLGVCNVSLQLYLYKKIYGVDFFAEGF